VTFRRIVHLLLGAVVLLPYIGLAWLFSASADRLGVAALVALLVPAVAVGVGVAFVPGLHALEVAAARGLLGVDVPEPAAESWRGRRRAAAWLLLNAVIGGAAALAILYAVPVAASFLLAPWLAFPQLPTGSSAAWTPLVGVVILGALVAVLAVAGAGLAGIVPRLLGPSESERMTAELDRAHRAERSLAQRNRLARELHDSIGHALTVTTLQAGAASRVLDTDPAFVARALDAIADAGRTALEELDHVLGLLREGAGSDRAPQPDLRDLDALLDGARSAGVTVTADVDGTTAAVPPAVSREAYRIVQEGLTNALRHAGPVPVTVTVGVGGDAVELALTNALGSAQAAAGGGRGWPACANGWRYCAVSWSRAPSRASGGSVRASPWHHDRMIGLLLVDDEELVRAGLRVILDAEPDFEVRGEASDGSEVPGLVRRLVPDVVLMDVRMPTVDGIAATRHLVATMDRPPRVLVLTTFGNDGYVYDALAAGATGFLLKRARPAEIVQAVRTVAAGESLLFPAAVRDLVATRGRRGGDALRGAGLTEREGEVLRWMARGLSNAEIARELVVGVETVKTHVGNVLAKVGARDRTQAVVAAYESGFIDPHRPPTP